MCFVKKYMLSAYNFIPICLLAWVTPILSSFSFLMLFPRKIITLLYSLQPMYELNTLIISALTILKFKTWCAWSTPDESYSIVLNAF
jgi:hypothetical protein